jgi:hypothetical protein
LERQTHFPLKALAAGFDKARERLETATTATDSEASFHSLFEALHGPAPSVTESKAGMTFNRN